MSGFVAYNGQFVSDDDLDAWEEIYARGEFPEGEHSVGEVINGAPGSMNSDSVTFPVQIPLETQHAIVHRAREENTTPSKLVSAVLTEAFVGA